MFLSAERPLGTTEPASVNLKCTDTDLEPSTMAQEEAQLIMGRLVRAYLERRLFVGTSNNRST